jgi:hypothetical protein
MFQKPAGSTGVTLCQRAFERAESYMLDNHFTDPADVERVRQLYADTKDANATMRLAIKIKCEKYMQQEAA